MSEDTIEISEKELKQPNKRLTQEHYGVTPGNLRESSKEQGKTPSEVIKPALKGSGLLSGDDEVEEIGPGAISEGMTIIVAREITDNKGREGTEFKRGRVVKMEGDSDQEKEFRLAQPHEVPESRRHAVLIHEESEELKLAELREDFQGNKAILFKIN